MAAASAAGAPAAAGGAPLRTLLIDNYDSYTYNLFQLIAEVNGGAPAAARQRPRQRPAPRVAAGGRARRTPPAAAARRARRRGDRGRRVR